MEYVEEIEGRAATWIPAQV